MTVGGATTLYKAHYVDKDTIYIGTGSATPGRLMKSTDGGTTWFSVTGYTATGTVRGIFFIDADTGWVSDGSYAIYKTTDAGTTWFSQGDFGTGTFYEVKFFNALQGVAAGANGEVRYTTDGGTNWLSSNIGYLSNLYALGLVGFYGEGTPTVVAAGEHGAIASSEDYGATWFPVSTSVAQEELRRVQFVDASIGYAGGGSSLTADSLGQILKTTDGGQNWYLLNYNPKHRVYSMDWVDANTGYASTRGPSGIFKSTDGGASFEMQSPGVATSTEIWYSIRFANADTGYASGSGNNMVKTTDGGATWLPVTTTFAATDVIYTLHVFDGQTVVAAGSGGKVRITTDGGTTWITATGGTNVIYDMEFVDATTGYTCGTSGSMRKTTDGGLNWFALTTGTTSTLYNVEFADADLGWVCGSAATLRVTTDGGANWTPIAPIHNKILYDMNVLGYLWVAGASGTILRSTSLVVNDPPGAFDLLSPPDGTRLLVSSVSGSSLTATWSHAVDPNGDPVTYTWEADTSLSFGATTLSLPSNGSGADSAITVAYSAIDAYVGGLGVAVGDSVTVYWRVIATDGQASTSSIQTFSLNVVRDANPVIFSDDFESGTGNWTLQGTWGLSTTQSHSPTHSLSESPVGNYGDTLNITATMTSGLDLSTAVDATLSFWGRYVIELGFDTMYVEISPNGGTSWVTIAGFNGENPPSWQQYTYSLSGFVGNSNVKVRFRFFSDAGYNVDGMYIDDLQVTTSTVDASGPFIVYEGPSFYQGVFGDNVIEADITDLSGVETAELTYTPEGGGPVTVSADSNLGSTYYFTIPGQPAGSPVEYYLRAVDSVANETVTDFYEYLAGNYIFYDDQSVSFYNPVAAPAGVAMRMTVPSSATARLVTALIRNYTDINNPNDSMLVHVWGVSGGNPGADLITPFKVFPAATLSNTSPMTVVDLRPYAAQLNNVSGDFFIGFTVPSGIVNHTETNVAISGRARAYNGSTWSTPTFDYHFRAVLDTLRIVGIGEPGDQLPTAFALHQNYPNPFNPTTTIKYDVREDARVVLKIYNVLGQEVRTLVDRKETAGFKSAIWDGRNNLGEQVSSGVYIYRVQMGNFVKSRKMMFIK